MPSRSHVATLDGLRGIAVLLVLWAHLPQEPLGTVGRLIDYAIKPGYLGVDIFFVLSGFLITRILLYNRAKKQPLRVFLAKRALRIFPIYYLAIAALVLIEPGMYLVWCATYTSNFAFSYDMSPNPMRHTWSLCVEEHFYLYWPLMVYWMPVKATKWSLWGMIVGGFGLSFVAVALHDVTTLDRMIYRGTMFRMASLSIGGAIAIYEPWVRANARRPLMLAASCLAMGCAAAIVGAFLKGNHETWVPAFKHLAYGLIATAIFLAALSANELAEGKAIVLAAGVLPFLGKISYGLYLYHYPIYSMMGIFSEDSASAPSLTWGLLAAAISLLVAISSFYVLERPILRIKDRLK